MIRIDEICLATETLDMWAGLDTALTQMVRIPGTAQPHYAYLSKRSLRLYPLAKRSRHGSTVT
ncbi:hypothetical protein ACT3S8_16765 [Halomonas sp. AOP42-D2-25]|uniref:hypothetical protein n=1 Tax=Halomonas sp. AOP42-D2-25 TaxID=3457666 RepID=UPI00403472BD